MELQVRRLESGWSKLSLGSELVRAADTLRCVTWTRPFNHRWQLLIASWYVLSTATTFYSDQSQRAVTSICPGLLIHLWCHWSLSKMGVGDIKVPLNPVQSRSDASNMVATCAATTITPFERASVSICLSGCGSHLDPNISRLLTLTADSGFLLRLIIPARYTSPAVCLTCGALSLFKGEKLIVHPRA